MPIQIPTTTNPLQNARKRNTSTQLPPPKNHRPQRLSLRFSPLRPNPQPGRVAYNVMIRGLTTTWQKYTQSVRLYSQMKVNGLKPDNFTYPFLSISCANLLDLNCGKTVHSTVFKTGLDGDDHVAHSLITMYAKCGELVCARKVFDEIRERDLVSWNSMISGYSKAGFAREAVGLFVRMREEGEGFEPSEMTLGVFLGRAGTWGIWVWGRFVVRRQMELNSYVGSALVGMYGKCGDLVSARRVFDTMRKKDVVTWNSMITGYAQNGASDQAIKLFHKMREAGTELNEITMVEVLSAAASVGALDLGKWIEAYASERDLQYDVYVGSPLLDMYAKCGSLDDALRVFENMPCRNEVSWNAMISALAFHGKALEALSLFGDMTRDHSAARPDEGRRLFDAMSSSFGLVPRVEHYSCMVDLFARAGHLHEAWEFIEKMPGKPDEIALGSLLGACQKWKNAILIERVTELLLQVDPSNSGNYVISSKIYANLKRFDESAKIRVLMRQRGVNKTPGCSWIEMEGQLHEFLAGEDTVHPYSIETYIFLMEEMKREGYVPQVDCP
ncbi:hypothetical protein Tsubulata_051165 [Turnera subulata]|uniref:Pentacotripeptide-repeat region of PRORP domain-containing protein n=1 Tax=Turnera subulata TaxID=218843 RepID=A0A9Q0F9J6_9ROSI|nr:hypothetical protein Tsubulata_051165 [Turnera subulata]